MKQIEYRVSYSTKTYINRVLLGSVVGVLVLGFSLAVTLAKERSQAPKQQQQHQQHCGRRQAQVHLSIYRSSERSIYCTFIHLKGHIQNLCYKRRKHLYSDSTGKTLAVRKVLQNLLPSLKITDANRVLENLLSFVSHMD